MNNYQPHWDKYEAVILLDALIKVSEGRLLKAEAIKNVSSDLRKMAINRGIEIDAKFRNENGIKLQMLRMSLALRNDGVFASTSLFSEVIEIYRNSSSDFESILATARGYVNMVNKGSTYKEAFFKYLAKKVSPEQLSALYKCYGDIESFCLRMKVLNKPLFETNDIETLSRAKKLISTHKVFAVTHRKTLSASIAAISYYVAYFENDNSSQNNVSKSDDVSFPATNDNKGDGTKAKENSFEVSDPILDASLENRVKVILEKESAKNPYGTTVLYIQSILKVPAKTIQNILDKAKWAEYKYGKYVYIASFGEKEAEPSPDFALQPNSSNSELSIDFNSDFDASFTKPISISYFNETFPANSWRKLYIKACELLYEDYPHVFEDLNASASEGHGAKNIVYNEIESKSLNAPVCIADDCFVETNRSANDLLTSIRTLLDLCRVDYENVAIKYCPTSGSKNKSNSEDTFENNRPVDDIYPSELINHYYNYLRHTLNKAEVTCRNYISALKDAETFAKTHKHKNTALVTDNILEVRDAAYELYASSQFKVYNSLQNHSLSDAISSYIKFLKSLQRKDLDNNSNDCKSTSSMACTDKEKAVVLAEEPRDYDKEKFIQVLMQKYRGGMQFDSIDFDSFREMYEMLFGESLKFDDLELEKRLRYCGVSYKDRLFPAESIMNKTASKRLFSYIDSSFSSGKRVLYYKAIFEDLADTFASCYTLSDENMLRAYIKFTAPKGKYYYSSDYMSTEQNVSIDHTAEVEEYLLNSGKPMATEAVCDALSHIPREQVLKIITTDGRFLRNAKGEYFHADILDVSDDELDSIANMIINHIQQNEYAIWADIWKEIQDSMPNFIENNIYLSSLGVRNALAKRLIGRFNFDSEVISAPRNRYSMRDIYQLYAKHHAKFSADDIYELSKDLNTAVNFDAIAKESVRVSHDLFVSKDSIDFNVDEIDRAIESYMAKDYIRIREIDSFLVFPNVEYEWNEYLLESYVYSYSRKFSLLNNGFAFNNVAGAVVKKAGSIHEFVDVCAAVLADSRINLSRKEAIDYLADVNMITRKSYKDIDTAIREASRLRAMKG